MGPGKERCNAASGEAAEGDLSMSSMARSHRSWEDWGCCTGICTNPRRAIASAIRWAQQAQHERHIRQITGCSKQIHANTNISTKCSYQMVGVYACCSTVAQASVVATIMREKSGLGLCFQVMPLSLAAENIKRAAFWQLMHKSHRHGMVSGRLLRITWEDRKSVFHLSWISVWMLGRVEKQHLPLHSTVNYQ